MVPIGSPDASESHESPLFLRCGARPQSLGAFAALAILAAPAAQAWVPYESLPNAAKVRAIQAQAREFDRGARVERVQWDLEGNRVLVRIDDTWYAQPLAGGEKTAVDAPEEEARPRERTRRGFARPARGRQAARAVSPDGELVAIHRDGNVYLANADGSDERAVTSDATEHVRYGTASWVYGEELDQTTAMWWSDDSKHLAFYVFDERPVVAFGLPVGWTSLRPSIATEAYPKPGEPNPIAGLEIYDVASGERVHVDTASGNEDYIYGIEWCPDGGGLLYLRTNRHQDTLELMVADPTTGASRSILTEIQPCWQENAPDRTWLADGKRFIWESERSGFSQYELWSLDGTRLAELTHGNYPVERIVRVDEDAGWLWYSARSSETAINSQLHRARLDGSRQERVTPDDLHWSGFEISPDGRWVVATREFVDRPAESVLLSVADDGEPAKIVATLATPEGDPWGAIGATKPEFLRLVAADGTTPIYGVLWKPSDFDPSKRYPLVVETYGGPGFTLISPRTAGPKAACEFGVLVASIDNRGTPGRGKAFETATYLSLGEEDCDDQAAAVRQLATRPYVDADRVAITGHSYGGYMTCIALLRYPEVFKVGVAGAPPTDWRNYDTIYTERYMRTPEENPEGYDFGSCVKRAGDLRGDLLILHGMVDDNVHPNNTFQFVDALQQKNVPFEMMLFPNSDHSIATPATEGVKWSFLLEHLGLFDPVAHEVAESGASAGSHAP